MLNGTTTNEQFKPRLEENACMHSPYGWAQLAEEFEEQRKYRSAADAWIKARIASQGHNRRARYQARADAALEKHDAVVRERK